VDEVLTSIDVSVCNSSKNAIEPRKNAPSAGREASFFGRKNMADRAGLSVQCIEGEKATTPRL